MMDRPEYLDWVKPGEGEENWDYRKFVEFPEEDAPEEVILAFMKDAKEAEKAIEEDFRSGNISEEEYELWKCQWPLRDDAPMEIIRNYVGFNHSIDEACKVGLDL